MIKQVEEHANNTTFKRNRDILESIEIHEDTIDGVDFKIIEFFQDEVFSKDLDNDIFKLWNTNVCLPLGGEGIIELNDPGIYKGESTVMFYYSEDRVYPLMNVNGKWEYEEDLDDYSLITNIKLSYDALYRIFVEIFGDAHSERMKEMVAVALDCKVSEVDFSEDDDVVQDIVEGLMYNILFTPRSYFVYKVGLNGKLLSHYSYLSAEPVEFTEDKEYHRVFGPPRTVKTFLGVDESQLLFIEDEVIGGVATLSNPVIFIRFKESLGVWQKGDVSLLSRVSHFKFVKVVRTFNRLLVLSDKLLEDTIEPREGLLNEILFITNLYSLNSIFGFDEVDAKINEWIDFLYTIDSEEAVDFLCYIYGIAERYEILPNEKDIMNYNANELYPLILDDQRKAYKSALVRVSSSLLRRHLGSVMTVIGHFEIDAINEYYSEVMESLDKYYKPNSDYALINEKHFKYLTDLSLKYYKIIESKRKIFYEESDEDTEELLSLLK